LICKICGGDGPFYASDPHHCRECIKARVKAHREANLERVQAYDRQRGNLPHRVAARATYAAKNPPPINRAKKAWIDRNPEKRAAHLILGTAVRYGKIVKPTACQRCGAEGRVEAHHADYSKPLEVEWLCKRHHLDVHAE
jgi:hypothetical protein